MTNWDSMTGEQIADEISKQNYEAEKKQECEYERLLARYEAKHGPIELSNLNISTEYDTEGDLF